MKVRVEADGGRSGTRIVDENGRDLSSHVTGVIFRHQGGGPPEIELELGYVVAAIEGHAKMLGPSGKEVRRIEYMDGTSDEYGSD